MEDRAEADPLLVQGPRRALFRIEGALDQLGDMLRALRLTTVAVVCIDVIGVDVVTVDIVCLDRIQHVDIVGVIRADDRASHAGDRPGAGQRRI